MKMFKCFLSSILLYNIRNKDPAFIQIESISSLYGFSQLISEPTNILQNLLSCIDLIFTDQPNLVIKSRIKLSLHENCHHQITYANFNLQIIYPPSY